MQDKLGKSRSRGDTVRFFKYLTLLSALATIGASGLSGCAAQGKVLEQQSIVRHYEAMRNQLKKKEQSGAEGGCPTCVY